ncbi:MAG: hypothetical protein WC873_01705 [Candidatus Gracilibacteria bacterium]
MDFFFWDALVFEDGGDVGDHGLEAADVGGCVFGVYGEVLEEVGDASGLGVVDGLRLGERQCEFKVCVFGCELFKKFFVKNVLDVADAENQAEALFVFFIEFVFKHGLEWGDACAGGDKENSLLTWLEKEVADGAEKFDRSIWLERA